MKRSKKNKKDSSKCLKINYSLPAPTLTDHLSQHFVQPAANMKEYTRDGQNSDNEIFSAKKFTIVTVNRQHQASNQSIWNQDMLPFPLLKDKSLPEKEKNNQSIPLLENFEDEQTGNTL